MKLRGLLLTLVAAVFAAAPVEAHHSFAVHFVADKLVTVRGKVDEFTFHDPHEFVFPYDCDPSYGD